MATPGAFHRSTALQLQAFVVLFVLAVLVPHHVEGRQPRRGLQGNAGCLHFSCGPLGNVSSPFRRAGDPSGCGDPSYELVCSDTNATIRIDDATYYVSAINYSDSTFWVVDAGLDLHDTCPLPRWNFESSAWRYSRSGTVVKLEPAADNFAFFVKCSREVIRNGMYMPVACLSNSSSFVYVLTGQTSYQMENLEPRCGYLGMIPLGGRDQPMKGNLSDADVVKSMRSGFAISFPFRLGSFKDCIMMRMPAFHEEHTSLGILSWVTSTSMTILTYDDAFLVCASQEVPPPLPYYICLTIILFTAGILKLIAALCRFVLAPLAVLIFIGHKYWKTRITIDAVEKFLRMQQMLGPTRYAYTDIIAITSHFRDKLGQGGYGSVFKGVFHPGDVHVAVKMLDGTANCDGEDFISEVSTIGRIHHINVVRLVGFCSEEMRRALVYEYMPRGSLDKYIFSTEKSFSWDKLNEIALGVARGINYLHQGCEMQILHFDIKPHNILLDNNFVPKVADFGLAKLYPRGNNFVPLSALRGTVGYIAPEMISRSFGAISSKSDVYSFGMLLLEMAGGRRNADPNAANSSQAYYPSWVYDRLTQQEVAEISEISHVADMHELERKLCIVGLWCIQMKSHDRPTMSEVIEMLEAGHDGLQMPSRPFFCDEGHIHMDDSYHLSSELTAITEEDE